MVQDAPVMHALSVAGELLSINRQVISAGGLGIDAQIAQGSEDRGCKPHKIKEVIRIFRI